MASLKIVQKEDWAPLLSGGVHTMSIEELRFLAVDSLQPTSRRRMHFDSLQAWINCLRDNQIQCKVWVCGSFMTLKPCPHDIDIVLWGPSCAFVTRQDLSPILDPRKAQRTFGMDLTIEPFHPDLTFFREAHHLGFHGFANDRRTARGIAELIIGE